MNKKDIIKGIFGIGILVLLIVLGISSSKTKEVSKIESQIEKQEQSPVEDINNQTEQQKQSATEKK